MKNLLPMTEQQALNRLTSLCSRSEYSTFDIRKKMVSWQFDESLQEKLLARLVSERYVDDARYARSLVNDKLRLNRWGSQKIRSALIQKHIAKDIIEEVLSEVDPSKYVATLRELLRQKSHTINTPSPYERNVRLHRFALSRGFTSDIIRQCLPEIDSE